MQEVGDGHSSVDGKDNITLPESRAISLEALHLDERPDRMPMAPPDPVRGRIWVRTFQRKLYRAAKKNSKRRFGVLYDKVQRRDVISEAWGCVMVNEGCAGVDGWSIKRLLDADGVRRLLVEIQDELESNKYQPELIRRAYIPKPGRREMRPLGIPTVKDRIVQAAVKSIIEPLFEADFLDCSYGFRPKRSAQDAASRVHKLINTHKWFVDVDLKSYFDTIPHDRLMTCVQKRVSDKRVLRLIRQWLKAGVLEKGKVTTPKAGSPQGGVISPLLSNIYLHELDRQWDSRLGQLTRYADDMVIVCRTEEQAKAAMRRLTEIVQSLGLRLNESKTHVGHIQEGFDFVGFTFREGKSPKSGKLVRVRVPRKQSVKAIRHRIKERLKMVGLGTPLVDVIRMVNRSLKGWVNYFKRGQCMHVLIGLQSYVCEQLRIFLRRRHGCKRSRGYRRWTNGFLYRKGLVYAPRLI